MLNEIGGGTVKIGNDLFNYTHVPMVGIINTSNFLIFLTRMNLWYTLMASFFSNVLGGKKDLCYWSSEFFTFFMLSLSQAR